MRRFDYDKEYFEKVSVCGCRMEVLFGFSTI